MSQVQLPIVGKGPVLTQQDLDQKTPAFRENAFWEQFTQVEAEQLAEEHGLSETAEQLAAKTAVAAGKTADALEKHLDRVEEVELQKLGTSSRLRAPGW